MIKTLRTWWFRFNVSCLSSQVAAVNRLMRRDHGPGCQCEVTVVVETGKPAANPYRPGTRRTTRHRIKQEPN